MYNGADRKKAIWLSLVVHGPDFKVSRNSKLNEYASRDGEHVVLIHPLLVEGFEAMREKVGPHTFARAYTSDRHNQAIGGAAGSRHRFGTAIDPLCINKTPWEFAIAADELGFGGIGVGQSRCHYDVEGEDRRWLYVVENGSLVVKVLPREQWLEKVKDEVP